MCRTTNSLVSFEQSDSGKCKQGEAKCLLCRCTNKHSGGTRNLWQHVQRHHKAKYIELQADDAGLIRWLNKTKDGALHVAAPSAHQPSVSSLLHKPLPAADKKRMDNVLIYFITRDTQSFSVVTNMAFVAYSRALHGSYRAILHPTLRCTTDAKYEQCSQSIKSEEPLKSDDRHPDQHSNRSVPHSDSTWSNEKLLSCQLRKSRHNNTCMPERHSTDNTAEPEERCTRKAAKICTIVTDRAAALNTAGGTT